MSYDQWDTFASWIPAVNVPEPVQDYVSPAPHILYDGGESPHSIISPPRQSISPWDESTRELRIVLHRHPVTPAFMQDALKTARKTYGQVRTVAAFVMRGMGDSQSIRVLISMGFAKDEARGTGQGVCYVRDMRKQEPKPKPESTPPKPEPQPDWLERELQITTDAIESRRKLGVHETFLTGLLSEQAEQQKMVGERDAVRESPEMLELIRQEEEIARQLQELQNKMGEGKTCQP